jgi:type IV secretory pathway VirB2 component (pilin)
MAGASISPNGHALLGAASWLEGLIHSPAVTGVAVLAIAAMGVSMLTGRIPVRRGLTVALGCFVLFGAPAIARGIVGSVTAIDQPESSSVPLAPPSPGPTPALNSPRTAVPPPIADPYAGASVRG